MDKVVTCLGASFSKRQRGAHLVLVVIIFLLMNILDRNSYRSTPTIPVESTD